MSPGFVGDYPYPHAHTVFFQELDAGHKLQPQQFRAKMLMFTFGNALARAHRLYGVRVSHSASGDQLRFHDGDTFKNVGKVQFKM